MTTRIVAAMVDASHWVHCDLSECRTKEEAKLAELEKRSRLFDSKTARKEMLPRCRYLWALLL